ncbi:MAG TPA: phosphotransferase, partial [Chloroflexota bacterium]|nr:phosphotransferase [Chloroflexota bacterium]
NSLHTGHSDSLPIDSPSLSADAAAPSAHWGPASLWSAQRDADAQTLEALHIFLAGYGVRPRSLRATALAGGWENLNLLIKADDERFVLRRYDVTAPPEVRWELELLRFLTARGYPTAPLVKRTDGSLAGVFGGRPAALFGFVAGRHPAWDSAAAAEQAAMAIGLLHDCTRGLALRYPRTRMENRRRLTRFLAWLDRDEGGGATEGALQRLGEQVRQFVAVLETRLADAQGALECGVVHHDAHGNNVLVDEQDQLVALLDFDDAHETYLLADVAVLLDYWATDHETHNLHLERAARVLRGYRQARSRPLTAGEWALLPDLLALFNLADATSYVMGRIRRGTPAEQAVADCSSYARFLHRTASAAWRETLRDQLLTCVGGVGSARGAYLADPATPAERGDRGEAVS